MVDGLSGFAKQVADNSDTLNALGVTRITYSFEKEKFSVTFPNPTYMKVIKRNKRSSWQSSTYTDYTKTKTISAPSIKKIIEMVAERLEEGAKERAEALKREADAALKKANAAREQAQKAELQAQALLDMVDKVQEI
jgi:hypothetical protein